MKNSKTHPYRKYESLKEWRIIKKAISDLIKNKDIELFTPKEYIIGYLTKSLARKRA